MPLSGCQRSSRESDTRGCIEWAGRPLTVTHQVHPVTADRKPDALMHLLTQPGKQQALVFCKTKHGSDRVGEYLERAGVKAAVINGNKSQGARTRALDQFKAGRVSVLVATDIAARGLDIAHFPWSSTTTCRWSPRTTSIASAGRVVRDALDVRFRSSSASDSRLLRDIQRLLTTPLERSVIQGFEGDSSRPVTQERRQNRHPRPHRTGTQFSRGPQRRGMRGQSRNAMAGSRV